MKQSIIAIFSITTLLFAPKLEAQRIAGYDIIGSKEEVINTFKFFTNYKITARMHTVFVPP